MFDYKETEAERLPPFNDDDAVSGQKCRFMAWFGLSVSRYPLKEKLLRFSSDKKRIEYMANAVADITGLKDFPEYLTLIFEIDSLFLNDDRHLNNIAVIEKEGKYSYCPIFDNGAGLLSNVQYAPLDMDPQGLIKEAVARPLCTILQGR